VRCVGEFVAEQYVSRADAGAAERAACAARGAAAQLTREGTRVRLVHAIFIPEDETCMHVYETDSAETVRWLASRAALCFERVAEAVAQ
jgi:hypothetical protein